MKIASFAFALCAVSAIAGCGSHGTPVIDDMAMSQLVSRDADGFYSVSGYVRSHQAHGQTASVRVILPSLDREIRYQTFENGDQDQANIAFGLSPETPPGILPVQIVAVGEDGQESATLETSVTLR